ncbi:type I-E CRISPR-associated protein Cas6/Cse3/CasE [Halomonas qinghailakensis]|uniref:Type I-E CRISPR-associated protein Cas6/Cse3/CasE n=1 Tax=Halomonas qinghailakensis TaxID=2937790 RepID=A0AA46TSL3_9GAMM|nr:type I-E CRISPR-associated protein Cas6/Cse3/CasE [Halomonas sp. ZZQ-149]UYO75796.1 type I-E CRISPR-associated protein Cas6/Cse3/CasE [Halomonas sp. ZZQ-149]
MYLSRVRIDLNGLPREKLFDVMNAEAYTAHQLLWQLFPDYEGARPFIFRQEMEDAEEGRSTKGLPLFYVLSDREPTSVTGLLNAESKPFTPELNVGDTLAFRLRANPTVAVPIPGKRGQRADVLMAAKKPFPPGQRTSQACVDAMNGKAREWLESRAETWGFRLPVTPELGAYRQHVLNKGSGKPVQFSTVDYEGLLEVTDPEKLIDTMAQGIGRAKAFGGGLLLLRRP